MQQIGKNESKKRAQMIKDLIARQRETTEKMFKDMGLTKTALGSAKFQAKL